MWRPAPTAPPAPRSAVSGTWRMFVLVLFEVTVQVGLLPEAAVAQVALEGLLLVVDVADVPLQVGRDAEGPVAVLAPAAGQGGGEWLWVRASPWKAADWIPRSRAVCGDRDPGPGVASHWLSDDDHVFPAACGTSASSPLCPTLLTQPLVLPQTHNGEKQTPRGFSSINRLRSLGALGCLSAPAEPPTLLKWGKQEALPCSHGGLEGCSCGKGLDWLLPLELGGCSPILYHCRGRRVGLVMPKSKGWVQNQGMVGTTETISWWSHVSKVGEST